MCKVSIIVPIYKVEEYIERCVRSLMEQTLDDMEYIFVNDFTPDGSMQILKSIISEYPDREKQCKIINHIQNKGVSAARNTGLFSSEGEYIIYCDSDDWVDNTMIEQMYNCAINNDADVVSCDFKMVYDDNTVDYDTIDFTNDKIENIRKYISFGWTVIWNLLIKRSIYVKNNIKSLEGYSYCEDFNLSVKLMLNANKIVHMNKILYNYNKINAESIMHSLNEKTMMDEQIMYMDIIDYFKEKGVYEDYAKQMGWRILKSKQELVLNTVTYDKFLNLHPDSHKYIWSCPFINLKLKVMMWSLTHHLSVISRFMLLLRYLRHGK